MPISLVGTLPASALNIGLAGVVPALSAKASLIGADVTLFTKAVAAQLTFTASPPNLPGLAAAFSAGLNPATLAASLNPTTWVTANAGASADLVAQLGLIKAQLAIVEPLLASFSAGLSVPGLAGWSYSGGAAAFGTRLQSATASGFGTTPPDADIQALVIATNVFASWQSFSSGFNTGRSARASATADTLEYLGELSGASWNTGLTKNFGIVDFLLLDLHGAKASLEGQINLSLGVNLPDPSVIVDAGLSVDISAALAGMVDVQVDLTGALGNLNARIAAIVELSGSITAALSAGGLSFWTYFGPASELGAALAGELASGLPGVGSPGGPAYGVAVCGTPSAMGGFGTIFKIS